MTAAPVQRAIPDVAGGDRMRALLSRPDPGPVGERLVLLHFSGRRSGVDYDIPVGLHRLDSELFVATGSRWRHNFSGGCDARITWRGRRRAARLVLVASAEQTARGYLELWRRYGPEEAPRRLGITVPIDHTPTLDEMRDAVYRCGLSLVEVQLVEETA